MTPTLSALQNRKRIRHNFGKISEVVPMPNLIEVQRKSYDLFLQRYRTPEMREDVGLQEVFKSVFPMKDFAGKATLEYVSYKLGEPKYDVEECQQRGMTYAAPLKVVLRLVVWEEDEATGTRSIRDAKEQDVFMGEMPLMTEHGTFVVNGTERVIVSQMHRSPGVFFDHDRGKTHSSGKLLFNARVIPYRGSWLDFEFDAKDMLNVRIDRKRKLPATTFLMALFDEESEAYIAQCAAEGVAPVRTRVNGLSRQAILNHFYDSITYMRHKKGWQTAFDASRLRGHRLNHDLIDAATGTVMVAEGDKLTPRILRKLAEGGTKKILVQADQIVQYSYFLARDLVDATTGQVCADAGDIVGEEVMALIDSMKIKEFSVLAIDNVSVGAFLRNTLAADRNESREEALMDIYRVMRPGEPPTLETAEALFSGLFFDKDRYDLSSVGRVKMNARLGLDTDDQLRVLRRDDILALLRTLIDLKDGKGDIDDIDHLGNRRVRSVGELMENQYRIGLLRMERAIKERMGSVEIETVMPADLINSKPATAAVREFFGSSQLSQFMDQTNPLSEITHKRRVSALGPGGLTRERAGFEVRDVHPTHYGRICPIETPEGPNIGLISSLATYAQVNRYGFIETPYRAVRDGVVTDEVSYISAMEEGRFTIAQANAELDSDGRFIGELIPIRRGGEIGLARAEDIDLMDVSPKQLVSVAAALIPFLENDDANRALMGSNMQRQAVPLLCAEAPLVGTGMESTVARDSGVAIVARRSGVIDQVDATRIVVRASETSPDDVSPVDIYSLLKFHRSNQNTCITQRPLVLVGDRVAKGDIIADGPSTEDGELALGRNVLVAFMPWNGYNFEDSILISERIVRDDVFTSIHIEEYEVMARDTKLGIEEITRDIPNVGEEGLKNLDEAGMIYVGAEVKAGDILVGKVTPKGESPMTPEEKLLRAIFGEKASDVRDTSLRLPPGGAGTVVEVRVFLRRGVDKDERARAIERYDIERLAKDHDDEKEILERGFYGRLKEMLNYQTTASAVTHEVPDTDSDLDSYSDFDSDFGSDSDSDSSAASGSASGSEFASDPDVGMRIPKTALGGRVTDTSFNDTNMEDGAASDSAASGSASGSPPPPKMKTVTLLETGTRIGKYTLDTIPRSVWPTIAVKNDKNQKAIEAQIAHFTESVKNLAKRFEDKVQKLQSGDELLAGVMKMVKVFVAVKRKLAPGDKMAGRHGNKGVISRILPVEDMPYLADGTPVDIVLNPLGVPSRMNVGQILETHLGWASAGLGKQIGEAAAAVANGAESAALRQKLESVYPRAFAKAIEPMDDATLVDHAQLLKRGVPMATPVFDGAREADVRHLLKQAGLSETGQEWLTDGRTGEKFDRPVTVGYIYMLKLHHLVDEKIHARSIGPYSLVTQQPLGGKAQFGGQRFGEMEVWALEAYGAAYTLQEMLTVKSDDVSGRTKVYEAIVRGDDDFESGIPESFNVLVKELKSLGLNVDLRESEY